MKDKQHKIFATLGASNHTDHERQPEDYYATDPRAIDLLLAEEPFSERIWEPACGGGHLSKALERHGHRVISTDIVYRGYGYKDPVDFLTTPMVAPFDGDIITNPPYKDALEFVKRAVQFVEPGHKVAMFLRLQFLEGKTRRDFFKENPPKTVYVFSARIRCAMNGDFDKYPSGALAYAWFVWEKGFNGDPVIKWIN